MSNTTIQIRRSTSANTPSTLAAAELAFTSNGDTLWIGSPSGSNAANVIHIASKISYIGNSTQLGATVGGSNSELASTYAIKGYVDGKFTSFSSTLAGLTDVDVTGAANNNLLVYNAATSDWEDHTISGTTNQINVAFNAQDITISLPNTVTVNTLTATGNVVINGTQNVDGQAHFFEVVHINRDYPAHVVHYIPNPTLIATVNTNSYGQIALQNFNGGVNASADFIAYPNNTAVDDNTGFIDMGIAGNGYNEAAYAVTGPNDGYLFASARSGASLGGSLVLATDSTGTNNDIKFFVGGFTYNADSPHMVLTGNNRNFGVGNANPLHKISVEGSARFNGNTDVIGTANVSSALNVGANVNLTTTKLNIGNSSVNASITSTAVEFDGTLATGNTTVTGFLTVSGAANVDSLNTSGAVTTGNVSVTGTANVTSAVNVGANVTINTTAIFVGNSSVNTTISAGDISLLGTSLTVGGNTTITGSANVSNIIYVGANVSINTSTIFIGNSTVNTTISAGNISLLGTSLTVGNTTIDGSLLEIGDSIVANTFIKVGNSSVNSSITASAVEFDGTLAAGNTTVTGFLTVSGAANVGSFNTSGAVTTGNITATGVANVTSAVNVGANVSLNTTAIFVGNNSVNTTVSDGNIITTGAVNSTSVNVGSNVNLTTSSITVGNSSVNSYITSTQVAFDGTLAAGNTTITGTLAAGNTTITGDLTVSGTVTTVDTTNIVVEDSLIRLARNQANTGTFVDAVDIGFYGLYGNTSNVVYTGLARDSSANTYLLFDNLTSSPDNVINVNDLEITTLKAYLISGGLVSNSTAVTITANSSLNVNITANTLTLGTALTVSNGGTGRSSLTNNAIVVGNDADQVTLVSSSTEGHVLQINSSGSPTFGHLDGGTF